MAPPQRAAKLLPQKPENVDEGWALVVKRGEGDGGWGQSRPRAPSQSGPPPPSSVGHMGSLLPPNSKPSCSRAARERAGREPQVATKERTGQEEEDTLPSFSGDSIDTIVRRR